MEHKAAVASDSVSASRFQFCDSFSDPLLKDFIHDTVLTCHEVESRDLFVDHVARERVGIADVAKSIVKIRVVKHEHSNRSALIPAQVLFHIHGWTG